MSRAERRCRGGGAMMNERCRTAEQQKCTAPVLVVLLLLPVLLGVLTLVTVLGGGRVSILAGSTSTSSTVQG